MPVALAPLKVTLLDAKHAILVAPFVSRPNLYARCQPCAAPRGRPCARARLLHFRIFTDSGSANGLTACHVRCLSLGGVSDATAISAARPVGTTDRRSYRRSRGRHDHNRGTAAGSG